jgi:hypothetical protein
MFKMRFFVLQWYWGRLTIPLLRRWTDNSSGQEQPLAELSFRNLEALRYHTPSSDVAVASRPVECVLMYISA